MSFIAAKCTECGAAIEVDDTKDAGICKFCGTVFVTQKVISHHNTYITKNITKNIYGDDRADAEEYLKNGETFLDLKDWNRAQNAFTQAAGLAPDNYQVWLGLARAETENFTSLQNTTHPEHLEKARTVANAEQRDEIDRICGRFEELSRAHIEKVRAHNKYYWTYMNLLIWGSSIGGVIAALCIPFGIIYELWFLLGLAAIGVAMIIAASIMNAVYNKRSRAINAAAFLKKPPNNLE